MSFFGHGLVDRGFDPGYPAAFGSPERENPNFDRKEIATLDAGAFQDAQIAVYSCNSATPNSDKTNNFFI